MDALTPEVLAGKAKAIVAHLCHGARPQYVVSIDQTATVVLPKYEIATGLRLAHFFGQVLEESGGLTIVIESLNYTTPEQLMRVWDKRFPSRESALPFTHNPVALAEKVYGGRMGNTSPGDGFRYVGRGMLQITGRDAYRAIGKSIGADLETDPALAWDEKYALAAAAAEWQANRCNEAADQDDLKEVTRRVNGGWTGLAERKDWTARVKAVLAAT